MYNSTLPGVVDPSEVDTPLFTWDELLERVRLNDYTATERLTAELIPGLKYILLKRIGADAEDLVQETLLAVLQAVKAGQVRNPAALRGFARTVAHRQACGYISMAVRRRADAKSEVIDRMAVDETPETRSLAVEKSAVLAKCLAGLNLRDREVLTRFYLDEEPQEQSCSAMGLNENPVSPSEVAGESPAWRTREEDDPTEITWSCPPAFAG